jgi:predicted RNA binding protein YcfA (HicA-like mRNA interferase family)
MSPKTPRNVSGQDLIKLLAKYSYIITRQKGSHIRLLRSINDDVHHITIPNHSSIKLGTLNAIINEVSRHLKIDKQELLNYL